MRCSARVRLCLRSLVMVVDLCVSRLVRLICCRIILTATVQGGWWSVAHLPSISKFYPLCVQVKWGEASLVRRSGVLPTTQFAYRKGLGTCDALLCVSHALQSALESGQEARILQIDFSAAFDRVYNLGILYKLCAVGIAGSVLYILTQFLSNWSQHVMVDGCVNWLLLYQEFHRAVFWARYCSSCTLRSFLYFWK